MKLLLVIPAWMLWSVASGWIASEIDRTNIAVVLWVISGVTALAIIYWFIQELIKNNRARRQEHIDDCD